MNYLALLLLSVVPYAEAKDRADKGIRPLVVQIGASWCKPCHSLSAKLDRLYPAYSYLDVDVDVERCKIMLEGDSVPQLIRFDKVNGVWMARRLIGDQNEATLKEFLKGA